MSVRQEVGLSSSSACLPGSRVLSPPFSFQVWPSQLSDPRSRRPHHPLPVGQVVEAGQGDRRVERHHHRHRHRLQEDQQGFDQVELPRLARLPQGVGRDQETSSASGLGAT